MDYKSPCNQTNQIQSEGQFICGEIKKDNNNNNRKSSEKVSCWLGELSFNGLDRIQLIYSFSLEIKPLSQTEESSES